MNASHKDLRIKTRANQQKKPKTPQTISAVAQHQASAKQFDSFQKMLNFRIHEWMPEWRCVRSVKTQIKTEVKDFHKPDKEQKTSTGLRRSHSSLLLARIIKSLCFVKE